MAQPTPVDVALILPAVPELTATDLLNLQVLDSVDVTKIKDISAGLSGQTTIVNNFIQANLIAWSKEGANWPDQDKY